MSPSDTHDHVRGHSTDEQPNPLVVCVWPGVQCTKWSKSATMARNKDSGN